MKDEELKEEAKEEPKKPPKLTFEDGTVVAAPGLGIHLIENGRRRWVPDTWTQTRMIIRMDRVVTIFPEQLLAIPEGPQMPSWAPKEPLF